MRKPPSPFRLSRIPLTLFIFLLGVSCQVTTGANSPPESISVSRSEYQDGFHGFWLAQCIANWTGLITEMDKIGGAGIDGKGAGFYTREDWGQPDQPNIWGTLATHSKTIDFHLVGPDQIWGADDDTDIEYMYQHIISRHGEALLTPEQIRDGWLTHIYSDEDTPFSWDGGETPENFLWVSNQRAFDLMQEGMLPPDTSDPKNNPHYEMIDAQLTTEIFGLYAPGRPDIALKLAHLPIRTTARKNAAWISEFYVVMHSLAAAVPPELSMKEKVFWLAEQASVTLPRGSTAAAMYDFVKDQYSSGVTWEAARDAIQLRYQEDQADGYDWATKDETCHGCFAAGINFAASLVSLFYGEGDLKETIKIGTLAGWDSDNPTATWGGLIGFMIGKTGVQEVFGQELSNRFNIHRTRGRFPSGQDTFNQMARTGVLIVDQVVRDHIGGEIDQMNHAWVIPASPKK